MSAHLSAAISRLRPQNQRFDFVFDVVRLPLRNFAFTRDGVPERDAKPEIQLVRSVWESYWSCWPQKETRRHYALIRLRDEQRQQHPKYSGRCHSAH